MPTTQTLQALASIDLPSTAADGVVYEWEVSDAFGDFSRAFQVNYRAVANLQAGYQVNLFAGYDTNRLLMINGVVDEVTKETNPEAINFVASGRDFGAREALSVKITNTWFSYPTTSMPTAHQIVSETAATVGMSVGVLEFPDYPLYNTFVAVNKTLLEIASELLEPWNLFQRVQYNIIIRDKTLSVIKVDWQNPPAGGCTLTRAYDTQITRQQQLYLDSPRLNEVQFLIVKGAAYKRPTINLGVQTSVEYQRNIVSTSANDTFAGQVNDKSENGSPAKISNPQQSMDTTTETVTVSTTFCDKTLSRIEKIYGSTNGKIQTGVTEESTSGLALIAETRESYYYINGGDPSLQINPDNFQGTPILMNADDITAYSALPDANALLWIIATRHWGIVDNANGTATFQEESRSITQYYYDNLQKVAAEITVSQSFDTITGQWSVATLTTRTHYAATGNSLRTSLQLFSFEDSKFKISTTDHQLVSGTRVDLRAVNQRSCLVTVQAETPQGQEIDPLGRIIEPAADRYVWMYDNPYLGQPETDTIFANAQFEQAFQLEGFRWETVSIVASLLPGLHHGQPISIEVESGVFRDYWIEEVRHTFAVDQARSILRAKRLTLEDLS
jgi:hypothetical protein